MPDVETYDIIYRPGTPPSEGGHPGFGYRVLREPGMIIERDVAVQLRDGVTIYVDVYRPENEEPAPVLLEWGPLRQALSGLHDLRPFPRVRRQSGMVVRACPVRGLRPHVLVSAGLCDRRCRSSRDLVLRGGREIRRPGAGGGRLRRCDRVGRRPAVEHGKVGMTGVSYLTYIQWFVAALNPPHLAAINPWEGCSDMYREKPMRSPQWAPRFHQW